MLEHVLDGPVEKLAPRELLICGSVRCGWKGPRPFGDVLDEKLRAAGLTPEQVRVTHASCFGACNTAEAGQFSHLLVRPDKVLYRVKDEAELDEIIREHLVGGRPVERLEVPGKTDRPEVLRTLRRRGLLQPPEPRGPAAQRRDRPRQHRGVFPLPRLPGAGEGAGEERSAVGDRARSPARSSAAAAAADIPPDRNGKWVPKPPTRPAT